MAGEAMESGDAVLFLLEMQCLPGLKASQHLSDAHLGVGCPLQPLT